MLVIINGLRTGTGKVTGMAKVGLSVNWPDLDRVGQIILVLVDVRTRDFIRTIVQSGIRGSRNGDATVIWIAS